MATALTCLMASPGHGASVLNAEIVVAPAFCALVLAWAVSRGDPAPLPVLLVIDSFVLQTQLVDAVLPLAVTAVAVVMMVMHYRRNGRPARAFRWEAASVVALGIVWAAPLFDQFARSGDLGRLAAIDVPASGWRGAWQALGTIVNIAPRCLYHLRFNRLSWSTSTPPPWARSPPSPASQSSRCDTAQRFAGQRRWC